MRTGKLHSIETMGLVDGPGIRTVFFLQGCPLRCAYCHNPDSQTFHGAKEITPDEVVAMAMRYETYYRATGGGVTFSGGEPLMQGEFLLEALRKLKEKGVTTCVDTSGYGQTTYYEEIFKYTDHILLDIKHVDNEAHEALTGRDMTGIKTFLSALKSFKGRLIIRHVMVPGLTDNDEAMSKLLSLIEPLKKKIDKIEILPYHKAGIEKYSQLNLTYTLDTVPAMSADRAMAFEKVLNERLVALKSMEIAKTA